jgi:hypothetical protein
MSEPENLAGRGGGASRLGHLSGIVPRYCLHFHNPIMEGLPTTRNSDNIARLDERIGLKSTVEVGALRRSLDTSRLRGTY